MARLYTVKELAAMFKKHENTIYKWIVIDHLFPHAFRVKDGWFVPFGDVRKLMHSKKVNSDEGKSLDKPLSKPFRAGFVNRW